MGPAAKGGDPGAAADRERGDAEAQRLGILDLMAVDRLDDVADAQTRLGGWAARGDLLEEDAHRSLQAEAGGDVGGHRLARDAEPGTDDPRLAAGAGQHRLDHHA